MNRLDILIKNGRVVDPARGVDRVEDVRIFGGRIAGEAQTTNETYVIDAEGCLVFPGLIDFHGHFFAGGSDMAISPDASLLAAGVTSVVDGGTAGYANFPAFRLLMATQNVRMRALMNVSPTGLGTDCFHENADPKNWNRDRMIRTYGENRDLLLGLKLRQSGYVVGGLGYAALDEMLELAEQIKCRVVVHTTDPEGTPAEIAERLRPNDVYCHVFQGTGKSILEGGKVHPAILAARERGVWFDASNGMGHFIFDVAERALAQGFAPDVISTDVVARSLHRRKVFGLPYLMSKYLYLGMPLADVVKACTATPAKLMYMEGEIGTLAPGACADVSVFRLKEGPVAFEDTAGTVRKLEKGPMLVPQVTLRAGRILFRQFDFRPGE